MNLLSKYGSDARTYVRAELQRYTRTPGTWYLVPGTWYLVLCSTHNNSRTTDGCYCCIQLMIHSNLIVRTAAVKLRVKLTAPQSRKCMILRTRY